jgi:hypothetical protein
MLADMKLIPHSHFGMPGGIRDHTLVYTAVIAAFLALYFDLTRIAGCVLLYFHGPRDPVGRLSASAS